MLNKCAWKEWVPHALALLCITFLQENYFSFAFKVFIVVDILIFLLAVFILIIFSQFWLICDTMWVRYHFNRYQGFCFYSSEANRSRDECYWKDSWWMLTNVTMVIILQHAHISNHHVVRLKLMLYNDYVICQLYLNKIGENIICYSQLPRVGGLPHHEGHLGKH